MLWLFAADKDVYNMRIVSGLGMTSSLLCEHLNICFAASAKM